MSEDLIWDSSRRSYCPYSSYIKLFWVLDWRCHSWTVSSAVPGPDCVEDLCLVGERQGVDLDDTLEGAVLSK